MSDKALAPILSNLFDPENAGGGHGKWTPDDDAADLWLGDDDGCSLLVSAADAAALINHLLADLAAAPERAALDVERLAAVEHEQWVEWSQTIAREGLTPDRIERWQRYWVPYADLDEATKEHDRKWARKALIAAYDAEGEKQA